MSIEQSVTVALGGNTGGTAAVIDRLRAAVIALQQRLPARAWRVSKLYVSAPHGEITDQPDFVNGAVSAEYGQLPDPHHVLQQLLEIERSFGRERRQELANGPRPIDLDLITVGDMQLQTETLTLPHPRASKRAFVLLPLIDLYGPDAALPGDPRTLSKLAADVADQHIRSLDLRL